MNINVTIHGTGKPLVLFHGWGFDHQIWYPLLPLIRSKYQLFLVDLPGFGLTPLMEWEPFKIKLLQQLPSNFAVAGWSMGGLFATRLAIEEPAHVSHLISIASSPRFIRESQWPGVDIEIFNGFYQDLARHPTRTLQQFMTLQLQGQPIPLSIIEQSPAVPSLQAGLELLLYWDLRQALTQLRLPAFYMFGRLDTITPRTTMAIMQKRYPHFDYYLFPKAAHVPFLSHQEEFINALDEFL